jgi:hypothetical protein
MKVQVIYTVKLSPKQIEALRVWAKEMGYDVTRPLRWWIWRVLEDHGTQIIALAELNAKAKVG